MKEKYFKLYDELPPPIAQRAKRNFSELFSGTHGCMRDSLSDAIHNGFLWDSTPEEHTFWYKTEVASRYGRPLPSVKTLPPVE